MTKVAVADHDRHRGFHSSREAKEAYEILDLRDALMRKYDTDAHMVGYVVPGAKRQPRLSKQSLSKFDHPVVTEVLIADVDNPGHEPWDDEQFEAALKLYRSIDVLETAGIYHTPHGARIIQPLETPIPVQSVWQPLCMWYQDLEGWDIDVDWACNDWTRHFRLPNVRRKGVDIVSQYINLDRMRPIAVENIAA